MALGLQHSFSWSDVALAAVEAPLDSVVNSAVGQGVEGYVPPQAGQFISGFASGVINVGVRIATGGKVSVDSAAADTFQNALGNSLQQVQESPELGTLTPDQQGEVQAGVDASAAAAIASTSAEIQTNLDVQQSMMNVNQQVTADNQAYFNQLPEDYSSYGDASQAQILLASTNPNLLNVQTAYRSPSGSDSNSNGAINTTAAVAAVTAVATDGVGGALATTGAVAETSVSSQLALGLSGYLDKAVDAVKQFFTSTPSPISSSTSLPIPEDVDSWDSPSPLPPLAGPTNLSNPGHPDAGVAQQTTYPGDSGVSPTTSLSYPGTPVDAQSTTMLSDNAREVTVQKSDVNVTFNPDTRNGSVSISAEGQTYEVGLISDSNGSPTIVLNNREATDAGGTPLKLSVEGGLTQTVLEQTISAYQDAYGAPPPSLPGTLYDSNLKNFQTEFAQVKQQFPDLSDTDAGTIALSQISYGSARINVGYGNLSITKLTVLNGVPTYVEANATPTISK